MLKIHEFIAPNGELTGVFLRVDDESLLLSSDEGELALPEGALLAVMKRYGAPFDADASSRRQAELALPGDSKLIHVRHLAGYDVVARDYLVLEQPGEESLCAMATGVAAALRHLGLAARGRSGV
jgi:hypothetical protein